MKVFIDRNYCNVDGAGCESCFASRIEGHFTDPAFADMDLAGCVVRLEDEDVREQVIFFIHDRDKEDKILTVDENNWPDAYDGWMVLYEQQKNSRQLLNP